MAAAFSKATLPHNFQVPDAPINNPLVYPQIQAANFLDCSISGVPITKQCDRTTKISVDIQPIRG